MMGEACTLVLFIDIAKGHVSMLNMEISALQCKLESKCKAAMLQARFPSRTVGTIIAESRHRFY